MFKIYGYPLFNPVYYVLGFFKYIYVKGMAPYYLKSIRWFLYFGIAALLLAMVYTAYINHLNKANSNMHGTAAFGDDRMMKENGYMNNNGVVIGQSLKASIIAKRKTGLDPQTGLEYTKTALSLREKKPGKLYCHSGDVHTLLLAPSGSGKGIGPVMGTLLSWLKSVIVLDPKGENFEISSKWRGRFSRVIRFAPTQPNYTIRWNPVSEIREGIEHAFSDCDMIADTIIPDAGSENKYFTDSAKSIVTSALLHIRFSDHNDKSLGGLRDFLSGGETSKLSSGGKDGANPDLGKAQAEAMIKTKHFFIITEEMWAAENYTARNPQTGEIEEKNKFKDMGLEIGDRYYDPDLQKQIIKGASDILTTNAKEKASVWKTIAADIRLFDDHGVRYATSGDDFRISDFYKSDKPISFYIVIPNSDIERLAPITKILISLLLKKLSEGTTSYGEKRLNYNVLCLLDEFPLLGKFPYVQSQMGICRGYGVFFMIVCQSLNQLVERYGENHAFLDHCTCQIIFAPGMEKDAALYSRSIGNETVREEKISRNGMLKIGGNNLNYSDNNLGRALLDAADIMRIPPDMELIKIHNLQPILAKKMVFYDDYRFKNKASKSGLTIQELYSDVKGLPSFKDKLAVIDKNRKAEENSKHINQTNAAADNQLFYQENVDTLLDPFPEINLMLDNSIEESSLPVQNNPDEEEKIMIVDEPFEKKTNDFNVEEKINQRLSDDDDNPEVTVWGDE